MTPPPNVEIHEHLTSTWWIEESGILCSVSKKNAPDITLEQSAEQLEDLKRITGGRKMCMLLDITYARPTSKESREFGAVELAKIVTALALMSNSPLGKMVANLFFNLKPPPYPTKMFTNEQEARVWLNQFL